MDLGAIVDDRGTTFRVWAPKPRTLELVLNDRRIAMRPAGGGYFEARVDGVGAGARYFYLLDGERKRPDPASRAQPDGVHAASQVIDPRSFDWRFERKRRPLAEWVIYELHIGTFTKEGTFDAAAAQLPRLAELGVTAVELMPVNSFPGTRNWGYDGVGWFAPQASYGGPEGLCRFIDAAHGLGLQVIQDVVYNHFGPEGNYLGELGTYFTEKHHTPWGAAIDYSLGPVRQLVIANARMFVDEYRVDGLRLDAVHAIVDDSPIHIVSELSSAVQSLGCVVIAESDLGDVTVIERRPRGWGTDAQWADDVHHALHAALTGERQGYYADFGSVELLARALNQGFAHTGEYSAYRKRHFGTPSKNLPGERFVVCAQNHDQVGNRGFGERLGHLVKGCEFAAAATYLLSPFVPLIFMGEETGDPAPFLYFTDHGDPALQTAVREGRRREFDMQGEVPDPQDPETFARSKIDPTRNNPVRELYQTLLRLRRERPALRALDKSRSDARAHGMALTLRRWSEDDEVFAAINYDRKIARVPLFAPRRGHWARLVGEGRITDREIELPPLGVVVLGRQVP